MKKKMAYHSNRTLTKITLNNGRTDFSNWQKQQGDGFRKLVQSLGGWLRRA